MDSDARERKRAKDREYAAAHREEARAKARAWHWANRERSLASSRAWYQQNIENARVYNAVYRDANAERLRAYEAARARTEKRREQSRDFARRNAETNRARVRAWAIANPEKAALLRAGSSARRRARSRGAVIGPIDREAIYAAFSGSCELCWELVDLSLSGLDPRGPTLDHIVPLAMGGSHTQDNLQLAHRLCNQRKGRGLLPDRI